MPHHGTSERRPLVTAVIASHRGEKWLARALTTLACQNLAPQDYEILVVLNGPDAGSSQIVDDFRNAQPDLTVRTVHTSQPGLSEARNLAVRSARGNHLTYVDDDDWVSPGYLPGLLAAAAPGMIPVAHIADVSNGGSPDYESFYGRTTLRSAGAVLSAEQVGAVLQVNAGKLIPTAVARSTPYLTSLRSGEDTVFWATLFARTEFMVRVVGLEDDCVYFRTVRPGSMGQQPLSYDFNVAQRLDCIGELERLRPTSELGETVIARAIVAQSRRINAYLRVNPDDHERVVEDARGRNLTRVRFDLVNEGLARDLAILYMFLPYVDASASVAARRIRERGVVVDVLTNAMDEFRQADPHSLALVEEYVDETRDMGAKQSSSYWPAIKSFARRCLEHVEELQEAKGPYRTMYSRAQWPASHVAAALVKIRHPHIRWLAEFSDPMVVGSQGRQRTNPIRDDRLVGQLRAGLRAVGVEPPANLLLYEWIEYLVFALADEVTFTNENQRDLMLGDFPDRTLAASVSDKSVVAHHPVMPPRFYHLVESTYALDPDVVNVGYFGTFYASRGLDEVVEALGRMTSEERAALRIHVFTNKPDETREEIAAAGLDDVFRVGPFVPFLEMLNLCTRLDVLLVNDARTKGIHRINPYLPSKWADYSGSGTPVWAIYEEGSVLSRMKCPHRSRIGDTNAAYAVLCELVADRPRAAAS